MTAVFKEAIEVLQEELELPVSQSSPGSLTVDSHELRFQQIGNETALMLGVIGDVAELIEHKKTSEQDLLTRCLNLHAARFAKQATPEVLTIENHELLLSRQFDAHAIRPAEFLQAAESMLNELEYWKTWLDAA